MTGLGFAEYSAMMGLGLCCTGGSAVPGLWLGWPGLFAGLGG